MAQAVNIQARAAAAAAGITGLRRNDCYARALELRRS